MELKITDLLDDLQDNTVQIQPHRVASTQNIKALVLNKVQSASAPARQPRRFSLFVLVAAVIVTFATSVFATAQLYIAQPEPTVLTAPTDWRHHMVLGSTETPVADEDFSGVPDFDPTVMTMEDMNTVINYAEYTESGVRILHQDGSFASGKLLVTVSSARVVSGLDQADMSLEDFSWEGQRLIVDGAFQDGVYLVLVDIRVESLGAELVPNEYGNTNDPYLFSAGNLLFLGDRSGGSFGAYSIDYFSEQAAYPEWNRFRLLPSESIDFTIGYFIGYEGMFDVDNISQFRLCNTSGNEREVSIDLNLTVPD